MSKVFTKGLDKDDQKEGLFKRLKNIEVTDFVDKPLSLEAKELIEEIRVIQEDVDYRKLKNIGHNRVEYDFSDYRTFKELFRDLYYKKFTIDDVEALPNPI